MSDDSSDFLSEVNSIVSQAAPAAVAAPTAAAPVTNVVTSPIDSIAALVDADPKEEPQQTQQQPQKKEARPKLTIDKSKQQPDQTNTDQQQQPQQQQQQQKQSPQTSFLDRYLAQDEKHNLVLADGTVIATAGKAREFFQKMKEEGRMHRESAMRLAASNQALGEQFKKLYNAYNELQTQQASTLEQETGLPKEQISDTIQIIKEYNTNPVKAIKRLLTQARMRGIDLSEIGLNGGVDPSIVREAIEAARNAQNAPQQKQQPAYTVEQAQEEARSFLQENPDAVEHVEAIAAAKKRFPDKSLNELWMLYRIHMMQEAQQKADEGLTTVVKPKTFPRDRYVQVPQQKRNVSAEPQDFSKMSFKEIAASILKGE